MLVAIFRNENSAYEGVRALEDLHKNNTITLFSKAVIKKNRDGTVTYIEKPNGGPLDIAVALLSSTLIGALGVPARLAVGADVGSIRGGSYDLAKIGVGNDLIYEVGEYLLPGKVAVIAELEEEWVTPVDKPMEAVGATAIRRVRKDVLDKQIERDAAAFRAEISEFQEEIKSAGDEAMAKLQVKLEDAKAKLRAAQEMARVESEETKREMDAKVSSLKEQLENADSEATTNLQKRIARIEANYYNGPGKEASGLYRYTTAANSSFV